jgi:hypothetical protein
MCSFLNVACTIQSNIISELITQELSTFCCSLSSCHCIYCIVYYYIIVLTCVNKVNDNIDHPRDHPRVSRVEQELITIPVHLQFLVEFVLLYL